MTIASTEKRRYAVYFSDGDKIEVIAETEAKAMAMANGIYKYNKRGYCTRVNRLGFKEAEVAEHGNSGNHKIRNLLFPSKL